MDSIFFSAHFGFCCSLYVFLFFVCFVHILFRMLPPLEGVRADSSLQTRSFANCVKILLEDLGVPKESECVCVCLIFYNQTPISMTAARALSMSIPTQNADAPSSTRSPFYGERRPKASPGQMS